MLEEHDDHIDSYLFVTGLGRKGYFVSRILLPAIIAFVITVALLPVFRHRTAFFCLFCHLFGQ
ncbi:MAG: ABC transporter permease, partial [Lachnospiraceae bacterium]